MGGGGNMSTPTTKAEHRKTPLLRAPIEKPPFTIGDIKKAIPPHCFKRSILRSFYYVAQDLFLVAVFYYIASTYFHLLPSPYQYLAWPIYWILQGSVFNGIWMLSHECGHNAMTDYPWVDDTVGFFLHSAVLVPYFSFKYSHRRHHANTNSLERDEVYVPRVKSRLQWFYKFSNNPIGRMLPIVLLLTIGWPMYAAFNYMGRDYESFASHYNPYGPIYNARERFWIFVSDAGVLTTAYLWYRVALAQGLGWVVCIYGIPILVMNFFLILLTYLHHTHPSIPHFDASEWEWLRGALSTVDRDYGVLNKVFHNITDTHVLHHLISSIPHYNAMEATQAIKPLLGKYYQFDGTPFYKAIWRDAIECVYVEKEEDNGLYWYKNKF